MKHTGVTTQGIVAVENNCNVVELNSAIKTWLNLMICFINWPRIRRLASDESCYYDAPFCHGAKPMQNPDAFILARALHVIGVVLWIGGVAFVTTVLLSSLRRITDSKLRLELFEQLEGRFAFQARVVTVITGLSGFYMLEALNAWDRYLHPQFWWLHLMTVIWVVFTVVLFVLEPLVLHRWFHNRAVADSDRAFALVHRMHRILLTLSLLAVFGAVAGAHGLRLFR